MIIMSVDLGKARTGIAVSDSMESFAFPKEVITEYNSEKMVQRVADAARKYSAELIVAGLPKNMDGSQGSRAEECRELAKKIEDLSGIKTELWDERCTTVAAYTALDASGTYGKKRKQAVDAVAATIILEGYLAFRKNKNTL